MEVEIRSEENSFLENIKKDFSYFIVEKSKFYKKKLIITISPESFEIPPNLTATKQTQNSIYYDKAKLRFNDYYGKAITVFNYKKETVSIYYKDPGFIHELVYLIILSRTSKYMDGQGLHKVHACGVTIDKTNIIFMMPSKGGKSTMFLELIRDINNKVISDDTPIVNRWGEISSFPIRLGHEDKNKLFSYFPYLRDEKLYSFKRQNFSNKYLVDLKSIQNKIGVGENTILINGVRSTRTESIITPISGLKMLRCLITHMIVGIGLPMILEYFLEHTIKDSILNIKNLFSRILAACLLVSKSKTYEMELGSNTVENAKKIRVLVHD